MSDLKKWIYWVACILVLAGAAVIIISAFPKKEVIPASKFNSSVQLSELSEDDCIDFIKFCGISIPNDLKNADLGAFVRENIIRFEAEPYSAAVYDYSITLEFVENIRRAVNEHYGVPMLEYGTYEFDECLYMTPISSYYPFEGTGENYTVSSNYFLIVSLQNAGAVQKFFKPFWKVQPVDLSTWDARFLFIHPDFIDITDYTYRACYPVSERYQIYLMDDEVWFATLSSGSDTFWSIYKLKPAS
ncbi:MAG TPA: hypothetical protein PK629_00280 [Oscillospiraceae bacterium]|mgnify:CR=1 FL=1|nr:hypothetical protein [Oscillospiraceae bacterium]HPK36150.1 hypothetical protein [Oscillospiraceae bacterium]HPR75675.1 hypothetical protein [Oscillospiraceae bacterium]